MARKVSIAAFVLLIVVVGLLAGGEYVVKRRSETICGFCQRHINPQAGVVAEVGGRRRHVCCAHCAITEGHQEHKPVRLIEVTDFTSGRRIAPEQAWYVDGSRIMACMHDMSRMDDMKRAQQEVFDRCSPGTFAFANRADAEAFVAANGGVIRSLSAMLAGVGAGEAQK